MAGISPEIGLSETQQTLVLNGLRGQVKLQVDGQLKTGRDIINMALLGAEEFGFGTTALIVLGCVMMRKCHTNTCPVGVATQDPELRKHFRGHYKYVVNYFTFLAQEVREYLAEMGFTRLEDIIGRTDLIEIQQAPSEKKSSLLDFSRLLHRVDNGAAIHHVMEQKHDIAHVKDVTILAAARDAIENGKEISLEYTIANTDRSVGAMLAGAVAKKYGQAGLPEQTIHIKFKGSAGQSFGAFLTHGISFKLEGEANDYLGKGLSGGRIAVLPPVRSNFDAEKNTIAGNTLLYGATDGEVYINGTGGRTLRRPQFRCDGRGRGCRRPLLRIYDWRTSCGTGRNRTEFRCRDEWRCGLCMGQKPQLRLFLQHGNGGALAYRGGILPEGTA